MKKSTIVIIVLVLALIAGCCVVGTQLLLKEQATHYYALSTIVQTVDTENDTVVIKDSRGNTWNFTGVESWHVNDVCSCLMDNQGTPSIYDDTIISTRYDGQVVGWIIQ